MEPLQRPSHSVGLVTVRVPLRDLCSGESYTRTSTYQVHATGGGSNSVMDSHPPLSFRVYISTKKNQHHIIPNGTSPLCNPARLPQGRLYRDLPTACVKTPHRLVPCPCAQTPLRAQSAPYRALQRARSVVRRAPDRASLCAARLPQKRQPSARLFLGVRGGEARERRRRSSESAGAGCPSRLLSVRSAAVLSGTSGRLIRLFSIPEWVGDLR